jgi:osmotically inducible protein OsmC
MAERTATTIWEGSLFDGSGTVTVGSGAFGPQPVSWARRTEEPEGATSPEELIAAAHAACYAMAFSNVLAENGTPPQRLEVTSKVGFGPKEGGGMQVTYSKLSVKGKVDGVTKEQFTELAKAGEAGCPVSNALRNNVKIELDSTLE